MAGGSVGAGGILMQRLVVGVFFFLVFLFGLLLLRDDFSAWLQTDMQLLLPENAQNSALEKQVIRRLQQRADSQVLALLASDERQKTKEAAAMLVRDWRASGLFSEVSLRQLADIDKVRRSASALGAYLLSDRARRRLITDPQGYFRRWAMEMGSPFMTTLLPLSEDLLGFSRFYRPPTEGKLQADFSDGSLYVEENGKHWVLLRARLAHPAALLGADKGLLRLLRQSRKALAEQGITLHVASSALLDLASSRQGAREGKWMSALGITLTAALFALVFGRWRCLWLFLPVAIGLMGGLMMVVAVFGGVHVMTLVIASSLIGLLLDVPLHWLGKSFFSPWREEAAMRALRRPFLVSTAITLLGYAMLLFTPLPVLRQTAVFSLTALSIAVFVAFRVLPSFFREFVPRNSARALNGLSRIEAGVTFLYRGLKKPLPMFVLGAMLIVGWTRCDFRDDLRDWVKVDEKQLADFTAFTAISGISPERTAILLRAETPEALLALDRKIAAYLSAAKSRGILADYRNIGEWLVDRKAQQETRMALRGIRANPGAMAPLLQSGMSQEALLAALEAAIARENISFDAALDNPLGAPWRALYLGKVGQEYVAVVRLFGIRDLPALEEGIEKITGATVLAVREQISRAFDHTRWLALALKFCSYPLAFLLLVRCFGTRRAVVMLSVPLCAVLVTVASIGWMGKSLSVFAVFALLLVMAIGSDYAIYALGASGERRAKLGGIVLACATTLLTFGLLAFSTTPAVAVFGLCIAIGVFFSALFACFLTISGLTP